MLLQITSRITSIVAYAAQHVVSHLEHTDLVSNASRQISAVVWSSDFTNQRRCMERITYLASCHPQYASCVLHWWTEPSKIVGVALTLLPSRDKTMNISGLTVHRHGIRLKPEFDSWRMPRSWTTHVEFM
ncbi:hypothetical protein KQX54_011385 [Cotesia glomerata]|uniref:Uncharacterized protein n=1 Tax=Cotesia glomerata TaxID=32391 RepID=A0AAV7J4K6_COTGL|nr:hypothetical protein KQX54_011385 [Cotesia glomerata]